MDICNAEGIILKDLEQDLFYGPSMVIKIAWGIKSAISTSASGEER